MTEIQKKLEMLWEKKFEQLVKAGKSDLVNQVREFYEGLKKNDYQGMYDIEDDVYHLVPAISKGQLDDFNNLPAKYYYKHFVDYTHEPTDPMKIGSMVHHGVLDPKGMAGKYKSDLSIIEGLEKDYKLIDGKWFCDDKAAKPTGTTEYKNKVKDLQSDDICVIKYKDYDMALEMVSNTLKKEKVQDLLKDGKMEMAMFAIDPITGLLMKIKVDIANFAKRILSDLKTTSDARVKEYQKSIANFRYHVQAAYYCNLATVLFGVPFDTFAWIVAEKQKPYPVANYYCDEAAFEKGQIEFRQDLNSLAACLENDDFPGYEEDFEPISLPHWAF